MHYVLIILMFSITALLPCNPAGAAEKNSCIECHKNLPPGSYAGHRYSDYTGSVHEKGGVRCEACHGGEPLKSDKAIAHAGVFNSADPKSRIYFKNLPQTCGKCHGEELVNFSRSKHYAELKMSGRGPSCVTCHGFMGTFILTSGQIKGFCTVCHNRQKGILPDAPRQVENVLSLMEITETLVDWSGEFVAEARKAKKDTTEPESSLSTARREMKRAKIAWHTFRMDDVIARIKDAHNDAKKTKESIR